MPKIVFIEPGGARREIDAPLGITLMEVARQHGVTGIEAQCGGACACATCHVYVAEPWRHLTGVASQDEKDMLECAIDPTEASRLGCQITLTDTLNGLVVYMPQSQR
jgi:2Fe-2S ferredoxin